MVDTGMDIRNVEVCGEKHMRSFLQLLDGRKQGARRVRRMFLSNRDTVTGEWARYRPSTSRFRLTWGDNSAKPPSRLPTQELLGLVDAILRTIDRDYLVSLYIWLSLDPSVSSSFQSALAELFVEPFLSLTWLTISAPINASFFTQFAPALKLRTLHVDHYTQLPHDIDDVVARVAPHLEHLTISGVHDGIGIGNLPKVIRNAVPRPYHRLSSFLVSNPEKPGCSAFPSTLKDVTINFKQFYSSYAQCSGSLRGYYHTAHELQQAAKLFLAQDDDEISHQPKITIGSIPAVGRSGDIGKNEEALRHNIAVEWIGAS